MPLDYSKGAALLGREEADAVAAVIERGALFRYEGDRDHSTVAAFEQRACEVLGARYAVATANGTASLRVSLAALGVGAGAEVIVPAFTFIATVNAVIACGAVPVFAEVDDTLGIDAADVAVKCTDRTAAVIAVHIENSACDVDALLGVTTTRHVPVIEDTAQSFGATLRGRSLGTFGALGAFSLQQSKNITSGEGGLVVTDDETLYLRAARYQDQGGQFVTSYMSRRGDELSEPFAGENLRMGELAGAVAGVQLGRLPGILDAMRSNKRRILDAVGDLPELTRRRILDPEGDGGSSITWFLRDGATAKRFARGLRDEGIPCAQMYGGRPVYLSPSITQKRTADGAIATDREYGPGLCPRTEALVARSVIVPVGVRYTAHDCDEIATAVRKVAGQLS